MPTIAGVVIVLITCFTGAGNSHHERFTVAASELPSQEIVSVFPMPTARVLLCFQILLHRNKYLPFQNRRNAALLDNTGMTVDANVDIVREYSVKAALVPKTPVLRPDTARVQIVCDVCKRNALQHLVVNAPHDLSFLGFYCIPLIRPTYISKRKRTIYLAILRIVQHSPLDVLCHVLAVELVDVHHRPQSKATCSGIAELLFCIQGFNAVFAKSVFILERIQHIARNAVRLVGNNNGKAALFCVTHKPLELRPLVSPP